MLRLRTYLTILSFTVIFLAGTAAVLHGTRQVSMRDPSDVVWMERMRRNALENIEPIRARINMPENLSIAIVISADLSGQYAQLSASDEERELAPEFLQTARANVLETSEWESEETGAAVPSPPNAGKLFEIKDRLWEITLLYIDLLMDIYSGSRLVSPSEIDFVEAQMQTFKAFLDEELARHGLDPVE